MTSDIENLHLTNSRQRDLLEVKDRQSIESDERERKTNLMIHSAQQLFKAEKDEVLSFIFFSPQCGSLTVSFLIFLVLVVNPHLFLVPVVNLFLLVPVVNLFVLVPGVELQGTVLSSCKERAAKRRNETERIFFVNL